MPFTGSPFFDKSRTIIAGPHRPDMDKAPADSSLLYSILYAADGSHDAATMEGRLKRFRSGVEISEY